MQGKTPTRQRPGLHEMIVASSNFILSPISSSSNKSDKPLASPGNKRPRMPFASAVLIPNGSHGKLLSPANLVILAGCEGTHMHTGYFEQDGFS